MWVEGLSSGAYPSKDGLADAIVAVLRAELIELRDAGAAFVQFDEPEDAVLLKGSYDPLQPYLERIGVDQLVLEYATPRAGDLAAVAQGTSKELGRGVVNPRTSETEPVAGIVARVREALRYLPPERLFLNPDCGFGTLATRPITTPAAATHQLAAMAAAAAVLRADYPPEGARAC